MEEKRQSGRTTRIANFVIDQLFSVGHCITADHTAFEYPKASSAILTDHLIAKVEKGFESMNYNGNLLKTKIVKVDGFWAIRFWIEKRK